MSVGSRLVCLVVIVGSLALSACAGDTAPAEPEVAAGGFTTATSDAELTEAITAYCAGRSEGAGPDIPQLKAAGLLPADWEGRVDVVLDPVSGPSVPCGTGAGAYAFWTPAATAYPLTVTGCNGTTATFDGAPERALSVDQISYQMALALGLADTVYGFWPTRTDDLPENLQAAKSENTEARPLDFSVDPDAGPYEAAGMGDTVDHSEQILEFKPDFILTGDWFGWPMAFGWDGPTPMESNAAEIATTYMGFTNNGWFCEATGDGAYDEASGWAVGAADARPRLTFEYLYADIRNLGMIFDVQDAAFDLIQELKAQVADSMVRVGDSASGLTATTMLVGYGDTVPASWDADKAMYYSQRDPINAVITQLGMTNVWSADENIANMTTAESFIARAPDVIILQSVYDDCHDVRDFIANDPAWEQAEVPAVVDDRLACVSFKDAYLGLGLPEVLSTVADMIAAG